MLWVLTLVAFQLCSLTATFAQPGKRIQPEKIGVDGERDKPIILSHPIELPDFAIFPGKNNAFKGGWQFPKLPGASAVILQFACKERPPVVLDWYRSQFESNKWSYSNIGDSGIRATSRTGHRCEINLLSTRADEGCRYQINFKLVDKAMHR